MSVSLTIRVDENDKKRMEELAKSNDRSLSYITNRAIKEYLDKHAPTKKK